MLSKWVFNCAGIVAAIVSGWWISDQLILAQETTFRQEEASEASIEDSYEVLNRGPVHEAFAEAVTLDRIEPLTIDRVPPPSVEELPPEQKPEGVNVVWIPGYWAWDDERNDFLWLSGVWRDVPPGQRWVPGYWTERNAGAQWTPGFWISERVAEVEYLPEPPQSLDVGPQVAAPSEEHVWVPGAWQYREARYVWSPGYWNVPRPGWVWVPARYVWCPGGWVFVDGYWDYPLERRGVLFAPVYYRAPIFARANYFYTPSVVIDTHILSIHLFARPRYCHYYFGDFYAPRYRGFGIQPCFAVRYCPLFSYNRWHHGRHGRDWYRDCRRRHDFFVTNASFRPAHTYNSLRRQRTPEFRGSDEHIRNVVSRQRNMAVSLDQYIETAQRERRSDRGFEDRGDRMRFARVSEEQRRGFQERAREVRNVAEQRSQVETREPNSDAVARGERGSRRTWRLGDVAQGAGRSDRDEAIRRTSGDQGERPSRPIAREQRGDEVPSGRTVENLRNRLGLEQSPRSGDGRSQFNRGRNTVTDSAERLESRDLRSPADNFVRPDESTRRSSIGQVRPPVESGEQSPRADRGRRPIQSPQDSGFGSAPMQPRIESPTDDRPRLSTFRSPQVEQRRPSTDHLQRTRPSTPPSRGEVSTPQLRSRAPESLMQRRETAPVGVNPSLQRSTPRQSQPLRQSPPTPTIRGFGEPSPTFRSGPSTRDRGSTREMQRSSSDRQRSLTESRASESSRAAEVARQNQSRSRSGGSTSASDRRQAGSAIQSMQRSSRSADRGSSSVQSSRSMRGEASQSRSLQESRGGGESRERGKSRR